ncbi:MAG: hypothetical protein IKE51_06075 [Solobacterium sp.]|nr:hypothetical protein [Solobacterium sp.]
MRLIDKDKLQKNYSYYCNHLERHVVDVDDIENMPTVDAKPIRHGQWLYDRLCSTNGGTYGVQRCSNCGYYYKDFGDEWNYCPHCGALMEEVEE